ncbi:MAG TPA: hypothetical protein PKA63_07140 [Oligoflexia bacterium]|nr:hypothetical protein [Oligoflexia bacterium]HMP48425.1 hypothetical protein [Oligoflexia bacterium]
MEKPLTILKTRSLDIALVLVVFAVFFLSGKNSNISEQEVLPPTELTPFSQNSVSNPSVPEIPKSPPANNQQIPQFQNNLDNTTPYEEFIKTPSPASLQDSFKSMEGGSISTEAIIERNAYFRKLSEQLKDLQGDVSTESTGREYELPANQTNQDPGEINSNNFPLISDPLEPSDMSLDQFEDGMNDIDDSYFQQ